MSAPGAGVRPEGFRGALELSREFFDEVALPSLREAFPEASERMAAGLVGNGSECMGFDDGLSCDHDWGVEFFLWLTDDDFASIGGDVAKWKAELWKTHPEQPFRQLSDYGVQTTVMTTSMFYTSLIGFPHGPSTVLEWRRVPESNLALAVNGEVFRDPVGEFTSVRNRLLGYYPEQLRLKKIAARCLAIAQTGQYNFLRIAQRGDVVAKEITLAKFTEDVISMVFMLNRRFTPYYKWAFRAMCELPVLASEVAPLLEMLYDGGSVDGELDPGNVIVCEITDDDRRRAVIVERICELIIGELKRQDLSNSKSTFLVQHGEEIQRMVTDENLSRLPTQYE